MTVAAKRYRVGIAGAGAIALASAAWLRRAGHGVTIWSPGGRGADALRTQPLEAGGIESFSVGVEVADDAAGLCAASDVLLVALPVNGHRRVMDALLPFLRDGQTVIVSSMASLSSLYLHEAAVRAGLQRLTVASFGNLLDNALRYTPGGGQVLIGFDTAPPAIHVSDTGPGVPDELRDTVFDRFVRGRHVEGQGSGLGLAIVRDIVALHGATVTLGRSASGGACVTIRFSG